MIFAKITSWKFSLGLALWICSLVASSAQQCGGGGCTVCSDGSCLEQDTCDCNGAMAPSCRVWNNGLFCSKFCTPIILDPFDEGFHLTTLDNGVKFHIRKDGPLYQMSWTDPQYRNGWLVLDRNGNGTIDDLTELFGNVTPQPPSENRNGFLALAVFDKENNGGNGNGFIDPGDAVYSSLRVWIDANHNGISEPSELHSLAELGIFKIGLHFWNDNFVDKDGNRFRYRGAVWDDGGTEKDVCYDVFIVVRPTS